MTVDVWAATSWGSIGLMGPVPRLGPFGWRVCARKGARTLLAAFRLWQQGRRQRDWFGQTTREERRPRGCAHVLCLLQKSIDDVIARWCAARGNVCVTKG
jgi:hypothetical protein